MKKYILFFLLISRSFAFVFCGDWFLGEYKDSVPVEYKVIKNSDVYNSSGEVIGEIKKDTIFQTDIMAIIYNISDNKDLYAFPYDDGYILSEDLMINNITNLNDLYKMQKNYFIWISTECDNVISARNPEEYLCKISGYANVCYRFGESIGWYSPTITIQNTVLLIHFTTTDIPLKIVNVLRRENPKTPFSFSLECIPKTEYTSDELAKENLLNFPIFSENQIIKIDIEIIDNHLFLYNGESGKTIQEYMQVNIEWIGLFLDYLSNGDLGNQYKLQQKEDYIIDFSNISDVKSLSSSYITISLNKLMSVTENLKLRSAEATTSEVITVMAAGTKVKILELGHEETIDGITSNWVKVMVLADATDRNGNLIEKGTTGWCYGGYLEETEVFIADNEDEIITADVQAVQEATPEVIHSSNLLLIVILIVSLVVILGVIIIIFVMKKHKKEESENVR